MQVGECSFSWPRLFCCIGCGLPFCWNGISITLGKLEEESVEKSEYPPCASSLPKRDARGVVVVEVEGEEVRPSAKGFANP